jgi:hypothetical protein
MAIVLDGTANTVTPLNGALGATTPSTVVATTVVASSTIKGASTIAVGNATPSASGAGITFPATQSASTDANTLDDYEEGTWTPTLATGATVGGYLEQGGTYTKFGNRVIATCNLQMSASGNTGNSASLTIGGLPFTAATVAVGAAGTGFIGLNNLAQANCYVVVNSGASVANLKSATGTSSADSTTGASLNSTYFRATFIYQAA